MNIYKKTSSMKRDSIKEILRENLLKEVEPDEDVVNQILDKIQDQGKGSLSGIERKYLKYASKGDVPHAYDYAIKDTSTTTSTVEDIIDDFHERGESIEKGETVPEEMEGLIREPKEIFHLITQEDLDDYVREKGEQGKTFHQELIDRVSQDAIDDYVKAITNNEHDDPVPIEPDVLEVASQDVIDQYLKKMIEKKQPLMPQQTQFASEELRDHFRKKKGKK